MFSVDPYFHYAVTWELLGVGLGALLAIFAIVFLVRRVVPGSCWQSPMCLGGHVVKKADEHHRGIRRVSRRR